MQKGENAMLTTTLILGTVFWTAVLAGLISQADIQEAEALRDYCRMECGAGNPAGKDARTDGGQAEDMGLTIIYGGRRHG